jgi:hypothetical protein
MEPQYYDRFLKALNERYPRKSDLANALMDLLPIEKESVYRRLRKDVYFSAEETMRIADAWDISLDNIISANPQKTRPFLFNMIEYVHPLETDYAFLEDNNRKIEVISRDPNGKMIEVINSLPRSLYCRSELLTRLFTMKWLYKYGMSEEILPLAKIEIPDRMFEIDKEFVRLVQKFSEVHAIHDARFVEHLKDDIVYFHSIGMITDKEKSILKEEMFAVLNYMEEVASNGVFPETGHRLYFYLAHTWLGTEYILFESKALTMSFVRILERSSIATTDKKVFDRFMNMVQSTKRSSVLISGSNKLQQVEFFNKQRSLLREI